MTEDSYEEDPYEMVAVENLVPGQLVDLEGDYYADYDHVFVYEYQRVEEVVVERKRVVVVFEHPVVHFPPGHKVKVQCELPALELAIAGLQEIEESLR